MLRIFLLILFFTNSVFAKSLAERQDKMTEVKDYQMSDDRGRLYVLLTNVTHISDYPMSLYFYSNCKKEENLDKDKAWKRAEMIDFKRYCDVDFEKTKIDKKRFRFKSTNRKISQMGWYQKTKR